MSPDNGQDRLLEHNYDGIQEYDNPMPKWWVYLFWATIVYSVLYFLNVPGIAERGRIANYEREMAAAEVLRAKQAPPPGSMSAAALLALGRDPARLAEGKATFASTCASCHREDGGGNIGPNLTDDWWIHGGKPLQVLSTVTNGVLDKGMPAWGEVLKPEQVAGVVAYVLTLHDTHPPNPKEPQGTKEEGDDRVAPEGADGSKR